MAEGTHLYGDRAPHNLEYVVLTVSDNLTSERVLTGTANQIALTDNGAGGTVVLSLPQDIDTAADVQFATLTLNNTGLHLLDTNASHDLIIAPGSDLTADRTLTLTTGDADRTITLSGNPTLGDWFDQSVKVATSPTFASLTLGVNGLDVSPGSDIDADFITINVTGTPTLSWDESETEFTSNVGFGITGVVRSSRVGFGFAQSLDISGGDSSGIYITGRSVDGAEKTLYIRNFSNDATPGTPNRIVFQLGKPTVPITGLIMNFSGNVGVGIEPQARLHTKGVANVIQLLVEAHSTQTANIVEIQKSDGTVYVNVTGAGILQTTQGRISNTTRVTTTYTVLAADHVVYCDTDGGAFTATLPAGVEGTHYKIINCGSSGNSLTIDGAGAETVAGSATQTLIDAEVLELHYNATEGWW